jgi:hypothetical protein
LLTKALSHYHQHHHHRSHTLSRSFHSLHRPTRLSPTTSLLKQPALDVCFILIDVLPELP